MAAPESLVCFACGLPLQPRKVHFSYLEHSFQAELPACPGCGQVHIPESLAKGRIAEVEMQLEDK